MKLPFDTALSQVHQKELYVFIIPAFIDDFIRGIDGRKEERRKALQGKTLESCEDRNE